MVQLSVLDRKRATPLASPADGDRHIVTSGATDLWAGWDIKVAFCVDDVWMRLVPRSGWRRWSTVSALALASNVEANAN